MDFCYIKGKIFSQWAVFHKGKVIPSRGTPKGLLKWLCTMMVSSLYSTAIVVMIFYDTTGKIFSQWAVFHKGKGILSRRTPEGLLKWLCTMMVSSLCSTAGKMMHFYYNTGKIFSLKLFLWRMTFRSEGLKVLRKWLCKMIFLTFQPFCSQLRFVTDLVHICTTA